MGFFQSLKDDLSEAVNELMEEENAAALKQDTEADTEAGEDIDIDEMLKNIESEMSGFVEDTVKEDEKKAAPSSVDEAEEAVMAALMAEMASLDRKADTEEEEKKEETAEADAKEPEEITAATDADAEAEADELLKSLDAFIPEKDEEPEKNAPEKKAPAQKSIEEMLRDIQQQEAEMAAMMGSVKAEEAVAEETAQTKEAKEDAVEETPADVAEAEADKEPESVAEPEPVEEPETVTEAEAVTVSEPEAEKEPEAVSVPEPAPAPEPEPVAEAPKKRRTPARSRVAAKNKTEDSAQLSLKEAVHAAKASKGMEGLEQRPVTDETAMISEGMTIKGDIYADGNMDVFGAIDGNVDIAGKISIAGVLNGDCLASEVYADGAEINGDVRSFGSVKVGQSTVIIGDVYASSAVIAGAIKGDIDVKGPVILDSAAIVMGNIRSQSVQISNGAVVEGMCSQVYAEVSPASFFEEYKKSSRSAQAG